MSEQRAEVPKELWHAGVQYDDEFCCPVMDESGREVAEAKGENEAECAAHARFIAAAPELYNTLLQVHSMAQLGCYEELAHIVGDALAKAR